MRGNCHQWRIRFQTSVSQWRRFTARATTVSPLRRAPISLPPARARACGRGRASGTRSDRAARRWLPPRQSWLLRRLNPFSSCRIADAMDGGDAARAARGSAGCRERLAAACEDRLRPSRAAVAHAGGCACRAGRVCLAVDATGSGDQRRARRWDAGRPASGRLGARACLPGPGLATRGGRGARGASEGAWGTSGAMAANREIYSPWLALMRQQAAVAPPPAGRAPRRRSGGRGAAWAVGRARASC